MKLRQALKIVKRFLDNGSYINKPYNMRTLDKALYKTYKIRKERCERYNEQHKGENTFASPVVIIRYPLVFTGCDTLEVIKRDIEKEIIKARFTV